MTMRITIGIDPGISGAIAVLEDGVPVHICDMPTVSKKSGKSEVSAAGLRSTLSMVKAMDSGAYIHVVIEEVGAARIGGRQQGGTSMFNFGRAAGIVEGVFSALPYRFVTPPVWKRHHGLIGADKDASRGACMRRWPQTAQWLARKKDNGRADAILIAAWAYATEQYA